MATQRVRIGRAAQIAGVTPDTLRAWEAAGRLTSKRSPGGQRLYSVDEVRAAAGKERDNPPRFPRPRRNIRVRRVLRGAARRAAEAAAVERPAPRPPARTRSRLPPDLAHLGAELGIEWDEPDPDEEPAAPPRRVDEAAHRVRSARADVEVERARRELEELTTGREQARQAREREERAAATAAAERVRLTELRADGRRHAVAAGAPADVVADVTEDLAGYVTPRRFAELTGDEAAEAVRARVERALKPWRDEQAREQRREQVRAERRAARAALVADGMTHAQWGTVGTGWTHTARQEALAEVQAALGREVGHDWTAADVRARVDELLAEWEDEEDEDEEDDE